MATSSLCFHIRNMTGARDIRIVGGFRPPDKFRLAFLCVRFHRLVRSLNGVVNHLE